VTTGTANFKRTPWCFEPVSRRLPQVLRRRVSWLPVGLALAASGACQAAVLRYCDPPAEPTAAQQDRIFRFGAIVKAELEKSGQSLALMSRSGLALGRFGQRYSHTGFSLKASGNTPWSVRQLYYACDESRPRLYDQGLSGFVLGSVEPDLGFLSVVFLPTDEAAALERVALDNRLALSLLGDTYSANAYPFKLNYQNCNQWVAEMLATAWGAPAADSEPRALAQDWLQAQAYAPTVFEVGWRPLMWAGAFIPWLHSDDHPPEDIEQARYLVSMPASIEAFVAARLPSATRMEFCHNERHVLIRRGWDQLAEGCEAEPGDTVIAFD
jgi:hypothetical protein